MRRYLFLIILLFTILAIAIPSYAFSSQVTLGVEGYEEYYDEDGSCPYLYTFDGSDYVLENDIFSVGRFPANEYTDYLFLKNAINPVQGKIKLQVREIPGEFSKVDLLSLVNINHPAGTKAGVDDKGQAHTYSNLSAPLVATYKDAPVFTKIYTEDRQGVLLYDQETLTLEFPALDLSQGAKLVMKVDGFERNPDLPETLVVKVPAINVQTEENGQWVTRSKFYPKEFEAYGVFDLKPYLTESNIKVRLVADSCKENVSHLIDYVALDNTADQFTQTALPLASAQKNGTLDVAGLVYKADSSYLDLATGTDYVDLEYTAPSQEGINDYFFVSKGYYQQVHNTFYVETKDDTSQWVYRYSDGTTWFSTVDVNQEIDLTAFQGGTDFPSAGGTYQVRISNVIAGYYYQWATLDHTYLKVDGQSYALISAIDTSTGQDALTQLQGSDDISWDVLNKGVILTFGNPIPVTQVTLNKTATTLNQGARETLSATVLPSNARPSTVTWTSSNTSIATVSTSGLVTGVGIGTARITATSAFGPSAYCDVTVNDVTPPVVNSLVPATNTTITDFQPLISAKITDANGIDSGRVSMTLNGVQVGSFNSATGIVSYKPPYPLAQGLYTVIVTGYDVHNNRGSATWSFTLTDGGPPQITNVLPPDKMATRTTRPTLSAKIADAGGIDVGKLSLTVDGTPLSIQFQPNQVGSLVSGTVYGVPATALSNSLHTAVVTAFDTSGNSQQKTWQFGINTFSEMPNTNNCTDCHNQGAAAIDQRHVLNSANCDQCHTIIYNHGDFPCSDCHTGHSTNWPPAVSGFACTTCHNSSYPNVPSHAPVSHTYTVLGQECQNCHSASLTTEHNIYIEGKGYGYDCTTCHTNTTTAVKDAIATGNTSCVACHGSKTDHLAPHNNTTLDKNCSNCHAANLFTDHITNRPDKGLTCDTCHASLPGTGIIGTVDTNCSRCHDTAHGLAITSQVPTDVPLYPGLSWSKAINATLYNGENWLPSDYLPGGKLYISKRSNTITGMTIRDFYNQTLVANGWTLTSPLPDDQSNFFDMSFTKDSQKARVSFYGGEEHTATPLVTGGYRVEVLLK